jgi:hypothetical protein
VTCFLPSDREDYTGGGVGNSVAHKVGGTGIADAAEHETMIRILRSRLVKLRAAHALFDRNPDLAVSHLIKVNDDTLSVDVVPELMAKLESQQWEDEHPSLPSDRDTTLSLAACFELLQVRDVRMQ